MSHINEAKLKAENVNAVERSLFILAEEAGVKMEILHEEKYCRYYAGSTEKVDAVVRVEGFTYDLGIRMKDGVATFVYDSYSGEIDRVFGRGLSKLEDRYIIENARDEAQSLNDREVMEGRDPFTIEERTTEDGHLQLVLSRGD